MTDARDYSHAYTEQMDQPQVGQRKGNGASATDPLPFVDMSKWDATRPPARQWWIEDRIPLRQPTLLSGEGAIGKSILLLQLLASTALDVLWLDMFPPAPGPVIYLGAEDEADEIHRRMAPILAHHKRRFSDLIDGGFKLLAYAGENTVLAEFDRRGRIQPTHLLRDLHQAACELRPKGIVIDTVSDVFLGDEIKRDQVRQFGSLMRRSAIDANAGVLASSHPSVAGIRSGSGLSGSTQWHNSVRARAFFKKPANDDDDARVSSTAFAAAMERLFSMNKIKIKKEGPPSRERTWITEV
jgi:RecA-family ATPase